MELLLTLDRERPGSLHQQLERQLRHAIRDGRLASGSTMPSTRGLAAQLSVARGVVVEAYEQLTAEGYLLSRQGGSTRVAELPAPPMPSHTTPSADSDVIDLRPGRPDVTEFPRAAWARAARRVLSTAPAERFTYLDGRGVPELREALADYLGRVRGACLHAEDIIIATGFMQSVFVIGRALASRGAGRVGVEEPYDPNYRAALRDSGLEVVPLPVDDDGIDIGAVVSSHVDAVIVTPAHQYPTGAVLAPERRSALLAWARENDRLIIEDDYDAEYRYDRDPVGALQGLDPDHVIYAGTASKSIAPGIRLAWMAVPPRLSKLVAETKHQLDNGSSAIEQLLLADAIEHGELDRHLRRMRPIYRRRRDTMLDALGRHLPGWRPVGTSAGLHLLVELPAGVDAAGLVKGASDAGVLIYDLRRFRALPAAGGGVVLGYASSDERRIEQALERVAGVATARA